MEPATGAGTLYPAVPPCYAGAMSSRLLFTPFAAKDLEPKNSIGARWLRLLDRLDLPAVVSGRRVAIKMHLGGGHGFTTIHPFFARRLVRKVREAGAREVFVMDLPHAVKHAVDRGYTAEVLGCPLVSISGEDDSAVQSRAIDPPVGALNRIELGDAVLGADALIDFSHVKGHGACGFGGASKNLSMGCVNQRTRGQLHALEGGLEWDRARCSRCDKCAENCPNRVISFTDAGAFEAFYHNCKYCQHCVLICPEQALRLAGGKYRDFQMGMARTTDQVLRHFDRRHTLFINVLMDVTIWCDCWGMTTPSLVPDIGILAGRDIVAVEQASLDLIREENLIPGSLPPGVALSPGGHLFEKIHGKDPHTVIEFLEQLGWGSRAYTLEMVD